MHIELNGRRFVLKSFTNGQLKEMEEHDAKEQDREKREKATLPPCAACTA